MARKNEFDRERVQKTLEQLEQTLKVMGTVVTRLREHLDCVAEEGAVQTVRGTVVVEGKGTLH